MRGRFSASYEALQKNHRLIKDLEDLPIEFCTDLSLYATANHDRRDALGWRVSYDNADDIFRVIPGENGLGLVVQEFFSDRKSKSIKEFSWDAYLSASLDSPPIPARVRVEFRGRKFDLYACSDCD